MAKVWHPSFKDLSIEVDEDKVAAYVAAGWLKNKSTRKAVAKKETSEPKTETKSVEKTDEPEKANETTSTGDGEAN